MREIRFRAWDIDNKVMRDFPSQGICELGNWYINFKGEVYERHTEEAGGDFLVDGIVLMQYTGLKDKNEKEIYEGDIIKMQKNRNNIDPIFRDMTVEWDDYGWGLQSIRTKDFGGKQETLGIPIRSPFFDMGEIIGNIYQNPELLTQPAAE